VVTGQVGVDSGGMKYPTERGRQ